MYIDKHRSPAELAYCVDLYMAQDNDEMLEADRNVSLQNLSDLAKREFFRVIREGDEIVGWVLAGRSKLLLRDTLEFTQSFYTSIFTGKRAVEAVILAHEAMIAYAEKHRIALVTTHASANDTQFTLCRILAATGWQTNGYLAQWKTSHHRKPSVRIETKLNRRLKDVKDSHKLNL